MKFKKTRWLFISVTIISMIITIYGLNPPRLVQAQQPTGSIPTVTGTPTGPTAVVKTGMSENINVRNYPSTLADQIGVVLPGQIVYVKGKTIAGDWLLIDYPGVSGGEGWVWALYMDVSGGELPIVEIPPTPAPKVTATIDPTLAAQFIQTPIPTRLPTFTPPPPVIIPTFTDYSGSTPGLIPVGLIIIVLIGLGLLIGLFIYIQGR